MYSLPQEIEVWYIIPALRKELSRLLVQKHGMTFERAGAILGISKAAVSQYLSNKRANKFKFPEKIKKEIEKSSDLIAKNNNLAIKEMERIIKLMKSKSLCCDVCKKYNPEIMKYCKCHCE